MLFYTEMEPYNAQYGGVFADGREGTWSISHFKCLLDGRSMMVTNGRKSRSSGPSFTLDEDGILSASAAVPCQSKGHGVRDLCSLWNSCDPVSSNSASP